MNQKALPAAILLALSHPLFAQVQETELEPVVVTANRVARTADETLAAVTVITRKDIEQQQAQSAPDLLRGLPGVMFSNNGGPGKTTSLFLRGATSGQTLVLIDGVRVGSATAGDAALQEIPVDQIERIEIVRGPRASLYGSEAIGGVIQIFLRKGVSAPSFSVTGGSRSTFGGSGQASIGSDAAWLSAGLSANNTHGINAKQNSEPDKDGYRNESINLRSGFRASDTVNIELQGLQTTGFSKYDGNPNETYSREELVSGLLRYTPTENLRLTVRLAENRDVSRNYKDGAYKSRFDTLRTQASWQTDYTVTEGHVLTGGVDFLRDHVTSSTTYATDSRVNRAIFGQYIADFGAFDAQLAGRHDDNEQFGSHNSGSVALGYAFSSDLRLRGSYGTAFKAPTFNALYYPWGGDPTLKPERSRSKEIGLSGKTSNVQWDVSLFDSWLSNMVEWIEQPAGVWNAYNTTAHIRGAEVSAKTKIGETTIGASYTQLLPQYEVEVVKGNLLARRARQTARIDIDHDLSSKWSVGSSLSGVGKRYDNAANTTKLGGYATLDLRVEYKINTDWRLQGRIENALDKRYETAADYNQPGIGAFVTVRYQPK